MAELRSRAGHVASLDERFVAGGMRLSVHTLASPSPDATPQQTHLHAAGDRSRQASVASTASWLGGRKLSGQLKHTGEALSNSRRSLLSTRKAITALSHLRVSTNVDAFARSADLCDALQERREEIETQLRRAVLVHRRAQAATATAAEQRCAHARAVQDAATEAEAERCKARHDAAEQRAAELKESRAASLKRRGAAWRRNASEAASRVHELARHRALYISLRRRCRDAGHRRARARQSASPPPWSPDAMSQPDAESDHAVAAAAAAAAASAVAAVAAATRQRAAAAAPERAAQRAAGSAAAVRRPVSAVAHQREVALRHSELLDQHRAAVWEQCAEGFARQDMAAERRSAAAERRAESAAAAAERAEGNVALRIAAKEAAADRRSACVALRSRARSEQAERRRDDALWHRSTMLREWLRGYRVRRKRAVAEKERADVDRRAAAEYELATRPIRHQRAPSFAPEIDIAPPPLWSAWSPADGSSRSGSAAD
eukprot:TRINITY_DN10240_c0_g3_i1.p1 TRINITY_DN10240_c0_g3~~TRINITY_DN10240_c0_g3_i1.p1  ORF type:complete len:506 (+),score=201.68 TRINITY_DN10240_c0_g3_i1:47-1519(+)